MTNGLSQDLQCIRNCDDPQRAEYFEQPVLQTAQMFVGESGSWLVVGLGALYNAAMLRRRGYAPIAERPEDEPNPMLRPLIAKDHRAPIRGWRTILLALPACCDLAGTTLMNVGLLFVAASIYQMTRGALVLFVGVFSVIFLKRRVRPHQWVALLFVVIGVGLVGLAGAIQSRTDSVPVGAPGADPQMRLARRIADQIDLGDEALQTVVGVLMIAGAQVFTATQFVLEEALLERYSIDPLKMVGYEGLSGFIVTVVGMIILHHTVGVTEAGRNGYFDAAEGWRQFMAFPRIAISSILIMISIGGFNFFGLSITRSVSATSRSIIDTCRTLFIWMVSLGLGWETFKWLQVLGFLLLVYGTFLFNDLVAPPWARFVKEKPRPASPLLQEEPIEHM
jgi:drug/metabolite transporter (DMT)-like permease